MRAVLVIATLALLSLVGWGLVRSHAFVSPPAPADLGVPTFESFARRAPLADVALGERYGSQLELLDPRAALPTWHELPRHEAVHVHELMVSCEEQGKAYLPGRCVDRDVVGDQLGAPPLMGPSGSSYAWLALRPGPAGELLAHRRSLHVQELAQLEPSSLDRSDALIARMTIDAQRRIVAGERIVLTAESAAIVDRDDAGPNRVRLYPRAEWDRFADEQGFTLEPRHGGCALPATSTLCFRMLRADERHRWALGAWFVTSVVTLSLALAATTALTLRARRNTTRDRAMILSTLTHELRSPMTAMRLDVEPLRDAYDALPERCQEPTLRLVEGVERLNRALHLSGRYLELFGPDAKAGRASVERAAIPSARAYFEGLVDEWPEPTSLEVEGDDVAFTTDATWLAVATRNLVDNAHRHGQAPVTVRVILEPAGIRIRVSDCGRTPGFSLDEHARPFVRRAGSQGLGLGLAIVVHTVKLLRAKLRHEPDPTTFEIALDLRRSA